VRSDPLCFVVILFSVFFSCCVLGEGGKCEVKDLKARTEETVNLTELVKMLRGKGVVP
jgi:hypothetical protein